MIRFAFAAAALLAAAPAAAAEDWRLVRVVGETPGRTAVLLDANSIDRTDPAKPTFATAMLLEGLLPIDGTPGGRHLISRQRVDCPANTIRILNTDVHDSDNRFILADTTQSTEEIVPGQPASVYRRAVCEQEWAAESRAMGSGKGLSAIRAEVLGK